MFVWTLRPTRGVRLLWSPTWDVIPTRQTNEELSGTTSDRRDQPVMTSKLRHQTVLTYDPRLRLVPKSLVMNWWDPPAPVSATKCLYALELERRVGSYWNSSRDSEPQNRETDYLDPPRSMREMSISDGTGIEGRTHLKFLPLSWPTPSTGPWT